MRSRAILTALLLALPAGACASAYRQPEVQLEGVRIGGIGLRGGTVFVQVLVTNPNSFDLETQALTYNLQLAHPTEAGEWVTFTEGEVTERVKVARRSSKILELPVAFRYDDMSGAMRSIFDTGTFNYRVSGDVRLAEPISRTFPYRRTGTVSLQGVR
jgi:LEA14-like dessication related protein